MKKVIVVMICVLLVVAVGLTLFLTRVLSGGFNFSWESIEPELANRQVFNADDFDTLVVDYNSESITFLPSSNNEIVLEEYMSEWNDNMLAKISTGGNTLSIQAGERKKFVTMWNATIKVYLPTQWEGSLQAEANSGSLRCEQDLTLENLLLTTTSGSIRMAGLDVKGTVGMSASSGSISANDITAGGAVTLKSNSGSVNVGKMTAQAITADTSSGSITLESAIATTIHMESSGGSLRAGYLEGIFELQSNSGSIHVEDGKGGGMAKCSSGTVRMVLQELTADLFLKSNSGGVRLTLPSSAAFHFKASTSSGSIKTPFDNQLSFNSKGNEANGSIGQAPQLQVECEASSGSVHVEWL